MDDFYMDMDKYFMDENLKFDGMAHPCNYGCKKTL